MKIGIIGVGGVGGYFGTKLARIAEETDNVDVFFIARNQHLAEIKQHGLIVSSADEGVMYGHPTLATNEIASLPILDVCLICVKSFDLPKVLDQLKDKVHDNTTVIALLNGVDNYQRIKTALPKSIVYPACVYIGTHIERPGKIVQKGGSRTIFLGPDPKRPTVYPGDVLNLFDAAGINYKWCEDIAEEIWRKYIFIAAFGMVSACENKTFGEIFADAPSISAVEGIMREIVAVSIAYGVALPESIVEDSLEKARSFPYEMRTSFQRDFWQDGKPNEREAFGDTIVRMGTEYGVKTPTTEKVNNLLKSSR